MVQWVKKDSGAQGISSLGKVLGDVIGTYGQQRANKKYGTVLDEVMADLPEDAEGDDYSKAMLKAVSRGVPFNMAQEFLKTRTQLTKESPAQIKRAEKINSLQGALKTVDRIDELIEGGNVGTTFGLPFSLDPGQFTGKKAEDRSELRQLGVSLIKDVSKGIAPRNIPEFETFKEVITNPNAAIGSLRGAVKGLRNIFNDEIETLSSKKRKQPFEVEEKETITFEVQGDKYKIPKKQEKEFRQFWKSKGVNV